MDGLIQKEVLLMRHSRPACLGLALLAAASLPVPAVAQVNANDEVSDRIMIIHQQRGTLAPGTRPKCFGPGMDETVSRAFFQCPWDRPNGLPRPPTIRSLWGLTGSN